VNWTLKLENGSYAGVYSDVECPQPPAAVIMVWRCPGPECEGHFSNNPECDAINLQTVLAYKRTKFDMPGRSATYVVGDLEPDPGAVVETRELVGVGEHNGSSHMDAHSHWYEFVWRELERRRGWVWDGYLPW
jgi:hypothetical protein